MAINIESDRPAPANYDILDASPPCGGGVPFSYLGTGTIWLDEKSSARRIFDMRVR